MSPNPRSFHSTVLATTALATALILLPFTFTPADDGTPSVAGKAAAAQGKYAGAGSGSGQGGPTTGQGQRRGSDDIMSVLEEQIFRGKGKRIIIILEEDGEEDSDRPAWAQGNRELNPHSRGGGQPSGAGTTKGDLYGDLWIILRDENGEPLLDANGHVQPILADGTVVQLTEDGELPEQYEDLVVEVELGRTSVSRAPTQVLTHALDEALTKLTDGSVVTLDEAGRLVVDGVAIDSPLENLALYTFIMTGGTVSNLPDGFDVASLLAASTDKTSALTLDEIVYLNSILGINQVDVATGNIDYYDFSSYDYSRAVAYDGVTLTYLADPDGDGTYETVTQSVMDAVFDGQDWTDSTAGGADDFLQSADDSRAVIEFLHAVPVPVAMN
ncbi:hypothetical protein [Pelagibius sp. 7325]|uniref:hypothetical protein n=1 Tax=Pelagibius sp. 7325 TaxID=3131994 RepID=UPI0030EBBFD6